MRIKLEKISLQFGKDSILEDLNLEFDPEYLSCLLGRSGSGKTSILKIIAGISPPFEGRVYFNDRDVTELSSSKRNVGWVPQQQLIFPGMNVRENISYGLSARGISKSQQKTRVEEVSKLVGLTNLLDRQPKGLSGGERQRVALARAIAPKPDILLLDEPFSSLDAPERDRLTLSFRDVQLETGITTIHVTHSPREAELVSDSIKILSQGKIIQEGKITDLISHPVNTEVARLLNVSNVVDDGNIFGIDNSIIIPESAIDIGGATYEAKIISRTRDRIYFRVDKIMLSKEVKDMNYQSGDSITFDLHKEKIMHFE